ncbi:ATP-grasp domain-containing protein [Lacticaseibacillus saniviri]|nr:ATP-grasp domain-containing protein [Lacticaseibacillus saniviri]
MSQLIQPGATIGIIGGGVTSYLLASTAHEMGLKTVILAPKQTDVALEAADIPLVGSATDSAGLTQLAELSEVVTFVNEMVDGYQLNELFTADQLRSGSDILSITQDRYLEKVFLEEQNLNILPYAQVVSAEDIDQAVKSIGFPCMIKPLQKGVGIDQQWQLDQASDIAAVKQLLKPQPYIVEAWIDQPRMLAVTVVKTADQVQVLPAVELTRNGQHLQAVVLPPRIEAGGVREVSRVAKVVADELNYTGVFSIQFLVSKLGALYIDRIYPTLHVSGGIYSGVLPISQYAFHLRALLHWPLPEATATSDAVWLPLRNKERDAVITQLQIKPDWRFRFYPDGTHFMGHVQVVGDRDTVIDGINATGTFAVNN